MIELGNQRVIPLGTTSCSDASLRSRPTTSGATEAPIPLPVEIPPEVQHVTQMLLASGASDPIEALMGVLHQIREMKGERGELDVRAAEQRKEVADLKHEKAIENAKKAAEKRLKGAPRWIRWLVSAVVTVVGAAAASFTGGAALGLAIAGAVLLLSAEGIGKAAEKLGASEKAAGWLKLGVQIAGSALMMGAGIAGGAATALPKAVDVAQKATDLANLAMDTVETSIGITDAVRENKQVVAEGRAEEAGLQVEAGEQEVARTLEMLGSELERMRRESKAMAGLVQARDEAARAALGQMGGE